MKPPLKLLWSEGVTLDPHQFQRLDHYHEARLHDMVAALQPQLWGLQSVQWNADALRNSVLTADILSLIFPDGEIYDAPAAEALPDSVDLSALAADIQTFTFYACVPAMQAHGGNLASSGQPDARYARVERETLDLFSDAVDTNVIYLRKTVRLLSHLEPLSAFVSVPVIRLRRLPTGGFEEDSSFLPPYVSISSPWLQRLLDSLLAKVQAKISALQLRHRRPVGDKIEFHNGDISSYWMLCTLSTSGAGLTHLVRLRQHHPEHLFERLTMLAGSLMTFSVKYALSDLPHYQHADAGPAFAQLDSMIRDLADTVLSARYFTIPLITSVKGFEPRTAILEPALVDASTALGLAVSADMPPLELVTAVPRLFKVGSPDDVDRFIRSALPGMELVHMAQVPVDVPVRPNTYYFSIDRRGPMNDAMVAAQAIAVHVPDKFKDLKIELFALKGA